MSSPQYIEWRARVANGHLEDAGAREERRDGCSRRLGDARCRVAVERNRGPLPRRRDRRGGPAVRRTARCAPQPANRESAGRLLHDGRLSGVSGSGRRSAAPSVPHAGRGRHARRVRRLGRSGMIASATATCAVDVAVLGAGPAGIADWASVRSPRSATCTTRTGFGRRAAKAPAERQRTSCSLDQCQHPGSLDVQLARGIGSSASALAVEPVSPALAGHFVLCLTMAA